MKKEGIKQQIVDMDRELQPELLEALEREGRVLYEEI